MAAPVFGAFFIAAATALSNDAYVDSASLLFSTSSEGQEHLSLLGVATVNHDSGHIG